MRLSVPLPIADLSAFSRSLENELKTLGRVPSHVELMNMLSRGGGYSNYQHLRASMEAAEKLAAPSPAAPPPDFALVGKTAHHFDANGRLLRWPARTPQQTLALWVLWSRLPRGEEFTERQISERLKGWNAFSDHALLRRALFNWKLVDRTIDGSVYRRIEQPPPPELAPLLDHLARRDKAN